jgi:hypothetical protein
VFPRSSKSRGTASNQNLIAAVRANPFKSLVLKL